VDWALDISEAAFLECDLRGIPANLIRRDPETQMIVRRSDFEDGRWKRDIPASSSWVVSIETMLEFKYADRMLVAAKRSGAFELLRDDSINCATQAMRRDMAPRRCPLDVHFHTFRT